MRTFTLSLGALAMGLASAHQYPNCESDNCYRNLIDPRFAAEAVSWCPEFLAGTTTAASAIPTDFNNCDGNVKAVSSACSCITYSASSTSTAAPTTSTSSSSSSSSSALGSTTTTEAPGTTATTTKAPESTTTASSETTSSTSSTKWTTSTITTTTTKTITSCAATVTNCPAHSTTVTTETIVTTTVCPVTESPSQPPSQVPSQPPSQPPVVSSTSVGTITISTATTSRTGPKPTTSLPVTAGAGHVVRGVEGAAAVAGLLAALL